MGGVQSVRPVRRVDGQHHAIVALLEAGDPVAPAQVDGGKLADAIDQIGLCIILLQIDEGWPLVTFLGQEIELVKLRIAMEDAADAPDHALVDHALADDLVGRTGFCIHPWETVKTIPKVGGTKDIKLERIRELAPTHAIVNIDENRREDADALALALDIDTSIVEPEPDGTWRTVTVIRYRFGSRPLAAASASTLVPARAAIAVSVSPAWTT